MSSALVSTHSASAKRGQRYVLSMRVVPSDLADPLQLAALTKERAVVMTTHSMEEVDALASNVGIVASKMLGEHLGYS